MTTVLPPRDPDPAALAPPAPGGPAAAAGEPAAGEPAAGEPAAGEQGRTRRSRWTGGLDEVGHDPDYRFSLANERTFLAWIRTSLALLAGGVAVVQLVPAFGVSGGRHLLGAALILLGLGVSAYSYSRWRANERAMRLDQALPTNILPRVLTLGLGGVCALALALVVASGGRG